MGTAGHVDHGKTVLVRWLTGVDTDRLIEEKQRGISIDLGFAPLELSDELIVAFVDVPGHERFIRNMVAGVTGIDAALVVVAADEGVMPQTREHLDILHLLSVDEGLAVITKTDLVDDDEQWLEMVRQEIVAELKHRNLGYRLTCVSAACDRGRSRLLNELGCMAGRVAGATGGAGDVARLPIDRSFTVDGFGTVVTGTLVGGTLRRGDTLEVLPAGHTVRARGMQVHGRDVDVVQGPRRLAVNVSGVSPGEMARGLELVEAGFFHSSDAIAVRLKLLPESVTLADGDRVRLHLGTSEVMARVVIIEAEDLLPGRSALARLTLEDPVCVAYGDRFIVRRYSPVATIGGGHVLDPRGRRYRKGRPESIEYLNRRASGDLVAMSEQMADERFPPSIPEIERELSRRADSLLSRLKDLQSSGEVQLVDDIVIPSGWWSSFTGALQEAALDYVRRFPLREGMPAEPFRASQFRKAPPPQFSRLLQHAHRLGFIEYSSGRFAPRGHVPTPTPEQEALSRDIQHVCLDSGFRPPDIRKLAQSVGASPRDLIDVLEYLEESARLTEIGGLWMHACHWQTLLNRVICHFSTEASLSVAQLRDMLGTTRKFAVPLAEALDAGGYTVREKSLRRRGPELEEVKATPEKGSHDGVENSM